MSFFLPARPLARGLVLAALLAGVGTAVAATWSSFGDAFPASPCADGWAGCLVGDRAVSAAPARDAAGRPLPSDARLGWFDLQPTAAFSPFVALSSYPQGARPAAVAVVEPTPSPTTPEPSAAPPSGNPGPAAVASAPPSSTSTVAAATPPTPSVRPPPSGTATTQTATTPPPQATAISQTRPAEPVVPPPATTRPTTTAAVVTPPPAVVTPPPAASTAVTPPPAGDDNSCTDLVRLEMAAMTGALKVGQVRCLDARVASESQQTTKDKVSRLLIVNAESSGNKAEWERFIRRHLEDIDRSDPDLCFKYASHLSRGGSRGANATIRWADVALENKSRWNGNTYKTRVFALYRLRAEASQKLWQDAEGTYTQNRTDENEQRATQTRGRAKEFAKDWLDYARASGQDTKSAMTLCASAAGNDTFCRGG